MEKKGFALKRREGPADDYPQSGDATVLQHVAGWQV